MLHRLAECPPLLLRALTTQPAGPAQHLGLWLTGMCHFAGLALHCCCCWCGRQVLPPARSCCEQLVCELAVAWSLPRQWQQASCEPCPAQWCCCFWSRYWCCCCCRQLLPAQHQMPRGLWHSLSGEGAGWWCSGMPLRCVLQQPGVQASQRLSPCQC